MAMLKSGALVLATALLSGSVFAQSYPAKPVRLVIGFPPGGPADTLSRLISPRLTQALGQPIVIENRGGAGGNVGLEKAADWQGMKWAGCSVAKVM